MVAASKNWQRCKISTWLEPRGGRGPWSKYNAVMCRGMRVWGACVWGACVWGISLHTVIRRAERRGLTVDRSKISPQAVQRNLRPKSKSDYSRVLVVWHS